MSVKKAVIPAAGLGTRMLPISRAVPKEMLPIVDRPTISYLVDEAVASGITDILIITNRDKDMMEDYFDISPEYEQKLRASGKTAEIDAMYECAQKANIYFMRQKVTRGLGHAVGCAKAFVGNEPFAVLYGDDIIFSETPVCRQLMDAYEKYGRSVCGVKAVSDELITKYSSLKTEPIGDNCYFVDDMIEKPKKEQIMSNFSILGRVLLTPDVFDIIENLEPGAGGEIQLTDAMKKIANTRGMTAVDFEGTRFDMGSKLGFLTANVVQGAKNPELGEDFCAFLREFVKTI
ncbi:MAG: UTP--glucose-1-phosphate uridylyltransferase [Ruminococcaceae bacterium]|nr:UTP--glucose-1-phosphate uridylyltransferase [Oscillospiraceae bacterium]